MENLKPTSIILILVLGVFTACSDDESSATSEMKRAPVQGGELEYEIQGDGEPVLLIHGALIAASFLPVMDEPSLASYRLIRYHRRGYAGSTAPDGPLERQAADAVALLRHLGVERAHIVGHSSGGRIALQLALDAPEVVHSLVLLEPAGVGPVPSEADFVEEVMEPARERYNSGYPIEALDIFMRGVGGNNWRAEIARTVPGGPEQAEQDAATFFEDPTPSAVPWNFDGKMAEKISQPIPILFLWGSETLPFLKEGRGLVHTWFPQAEDHQVRGVTHSLQMEDPQAVTEAIADFLDRHPLTENSNQ